MIDAVTRAIYGENPPTKSADLERAITIAHEDLLAEHVPISEVRRIASGLFAGPIPYSTYDLSVATALSFFKNLENFHVLKDVQIAARMRALNWMKASKIAPGLLKLFEDTLYRLYKPSAETAVKPDGPQEPNEPAREYSGGLADAVRFTAAARQWSETCRLIGAFKTVCKTAGIEAEHTHAVNAILAVDNCIIKLLRVGDYDAMLDQEDQLMAATEHLVKAIDQLSQSAHVRHVDVSATAAIIRSLSAALEARGMLKR